MLDPHSKIWNFIHPKGNATSFLKLGHNNAEGDVHQAKVNGISIVQFPAGKTGFVNVINISRPKKTLSRKVKGANNEVGRERV